MKRRIGSRLYDTDSSELIAETDFGTIYRKRTRGREWFIRYHDPDMIEPLEDAEARAMLGESSYRDPEPESKRTWISIDRETHDRIARYAKARGLSIGEAVRTLTETI